MDTKVLTKIMGLTGTILPYGLVSAPDSEFALLCDGSALLAGTADRLRQALIDDAFPWGDDGSGSPLLPDGRGRSLIGAGTGSGLTARTVGDTGGAETHQLTAAEMPAHTHDAGTSVVRANGTGSLVDVRDDSAGDVATTSVGSDQPHNNMQPFLVTNFIILT